MRTTSGALLVLSLTLLLEDALLVAGAAQSAKTRKAEENNGKIGLALHGGSVSAANVCGSVMRGFQQQKITIDGEERPAMDAFHYTSGLSGGNFPSLMYAFAQNTTSDEILDADGIVDPEDITPESLRTVPEKSMFAIFDRTILYSFIRAVIDTYIHGWDFWPLFVYYHFLEPLSIPGGKQMGTEDVKQREDAKPTPVAEFTMSGPPELYPEWIYDVMSRELAADIKEAGASEPNVDMPPLFIERARAALDVLEGQLGYELPPEVIEYFQIPQATLLDALKKSGYQVPVPAFSTPEHVEIPFVAGTMNFSAVANMTKTAEPLDFAPFVGDATDPTSLFSLERLLAFGTALIPIFLNPESSLGAMFPKELVDLIGDPLTMAVPTADGSEHRNMTFIDGGYNDGTGIPALVKLKCRKIVSVLMTTGGNLFLNPLNKDPVSFVTMSMSGFFGVVNRFSGLNADSFAVGNDFSNHLFDLYSNDQNQLHKLADIIQKQHEAGNPLVATLNDLEVMDNPFWGTEKGEKVDLTVIVALGVPKRFSDRVSLSAAPPAVNQTQVDEHGFFTNPDLNLVPNALSRRNIVLFEDSIKDDEGNVIFDLPEIETEVPIEFALGIEETRMTNFLLSWVVKDAWDGLKDVDGNVIFDGFKSILDPAAEEETTTTTAAPPATTTTTTTAGTEATTTAAPPATMTTTTTAGTEATTTTTTAGTEVKAQGADDTSPAATLKAASTAAATALAMGTLALVVL